MKGKKLPQKSCPRHQKISHEAKFPHNQEQVHRRWCFGVGASALVHRRWCIGVGASAQITKPTTNLKRKRLP